MRVFLCFLFLLFSLAIITCSSSNNEIDRQQSLISDCTHTEKKINIINAETLKKNQLCCIPDSSMFKLKRIDATLNVNEGTIVKQMKELSKEQVNQWLKPLIDKVGYGRLLEYPIHYKMESFQKVTKKYYSIIIMAHNEIIEEKNSLPKVSSDQFIINLDTEGCFIDGLLISRYIPGESLGDSGFVPSKGLILNIEKRSRFIADTIKVYEKEKYLNPPTSSEDKDTWEELNETGYVIKEDGKIILFKTRQKIKDSKMIK